MSMNMNSLYGSGYDMMGSMQAMQGGYGNSMGSSGNMMSTFKQKYGCDLCYSQGPNFNKYNLPVNQLPKEMVKPSFFKSIMNRLFDGV